MRILKINRFSNLYIDTYMHYMYNLIRTVGSKLIHPSGGHKMKFSFDERTHTISLTAESTGDQNILKEFVVKKLLQLPIQWTVEDTADESSPYFVVSATAAIPQAGVLVITNLDRGITVDELVGRARRAGAATGPVTDDGKEYYRIHFPNRPPQDYYREGLHAAIRDLNNPSA